MDPVDRNSGAPRLTGIGRFVRLLTTDPKENGKPDLPCHGTEHLKKRRTTRHWR